MKHSQRVKGGWNDVNEEHMMPFTIFQEWTRIQQLISTWFKDNYMCLKEIWTIKKKFIFLHIIESKRSKEPLNKNNFLEM